MIHLFHRRITFSLALTIGFLIMILIGSILLSLPFADKAGQATAYSDALFTATSAVCVTGLSTVTTATHWSFFGQLVIMILVEVGGLGFMTFAVMLSNFAHQRMSLGARMLTGEALNLNHLSQFRVVRLIIRLSLVIQLIGAGLLFIALEPQLGLGKGIWYSLFHSVAAYCNAGFDLFGPSLEQLNNNPYVLTVIMLLIGAGSFGFLVWRDLLTYNIRHKITLHTRFALTVGLIILVLSIIGFLFSEQNLKQFSGSLNGVDRFFNTLFLAVTPRTAGIAITIILMFIGGTPGSTAGGVKTSTIGILFLQSIGTFTGKEPAFSHRRFTRDNINRALTLFFSAILLIILATLLLTMTQPSLGHNGVTKAVFEAVSAFGTVGLTLGLTPHLNLFGKIIIMALMFIGRVGIYTFMYSIFKSHPTKQSYRYPEEEIIIG
ncbi:TrkH family potassium uptake protein [Lactobacillus amylovorus]|uniref:TrkH family potassium uptake protein n=1 Tax=Lactobacillus amylovorus TaxID=1604 RepID=UPI00309AAF08